MLSALEEAAQPETTRHQRLYESKWGGGATATTTDGRRSRLESQLGPKSQLDPNAKLDPNSQKAETNFVSRTGIFTFSTSGGIIISQSIEEAVAKAEEKRAQARRLRPGVSETPVTKPKKKKKDVVSGFRHQYSLQQQAHRAFRPPEKLTTTGSKFGQHAAIDYGNGIDLNNNRPKAKSESPKAKDERRPGTVYSPEAQKEQKELRETDEVFTSIPVLDLMHCGNKLLTQGILKDLSENVTDKTVPHLRNAILACNQHLNMHQPEPSQEDEDGSTRSMDPIGNVQSGKKFAQRQQHRWGQVNTFMTQMDVWHSGGNQFHLTREGSSNRPGMRGQKVVRRDPAPHNFREDEVPYILRKGWRPTSSESGRLDREFVNLNLVMQSQTRALPKVVAEVLVDDDSLLALSRNADEQSRMKPHRRGLQSEVYERQSIPSRPPSSALMTLVPDSYERNPHSNPPFRRGTYLSQAEILKLSGAAVHNFGQTMVYDKDNTEFEAADHAGPIRPHLSVHHAHRREDGDDAGALQSSRPSTAWSGPHSRPLSRGGSTFSAGRTAEPQADRPRTAESFGMWLSASAAVDPLFIARCTPHALFAEAPLVRPSVTVVNQDDSSHLNTGKQSRNATNANANDDKANNRTPSRAPSASRSRPMTPSRPITLSRPTTPEEFSFLPPQSSQRVNWFRHNTVHAVHGFPDDYLGSDTMAEMQPTSPLSPGLSSNASPGAQSSSKNPQSPGGHFENAMLALNLPPKTPPAVPNLALLSPSSAHSSSTMRQDNLLSPTSHSSTLEIQAPHGVHVEGLRTIEPGWHSNLPRNVSRAASPQLPHAERTPSRPLGPTTLELMVLDDDGKEALALSHPGTPSHAVAPVGERAEARRLRLTSSNESMFEALKHHDKDFMTSLHDSLKRPGARDPGLTASGAGPAASATVTSGADSEVIAPIRQQGHAGPFTRGNRSNVPRNRLGRRKVSDERDTGTAHQQLGSDRDKRNGHSVWSLNPPLPEHQSPVHQSPIVPKPGRAGRATGTGGARARGEGAQGMTRIQLRPTPDLNVTSLNSPGPGSLSSWTPRGAPRSPPLGVVPSMNLGSPAMECPESDMSAGNGT